jgi:hypothetical protein
LYVATLDDDVRTFKRSTLYFHFKQGGQPSQRLDKNELFLHRVTQYGHLKQLADVVMKYSSDLVCIVKITHMEGEEIFGSYK